MPRQIGVGHRNVIIQAMKDNQHDLGYKFGSEPKHMEFFNEWNQIQCGLETPDFQANFQLQQMPGCCAVLVLSYIRCHPYTQENIDKVIEIVEKAAFDAGFGSVIMTQVVPAFSQMLWKGEPWIKCLNREWKASPAFRNAKSGNLVTYLSKDLAQPRKRPELEEPVYAE